MRENMWKKSVCPDHLDALGDIGGEVIIGDVFLGDDVGDLVERCDNKGGERAQFCGGHGSNCFARLLDEGAGDGDVVIFVGGVAHLWVQAAHA